MPSREKGVFTSQVVEALSRNDQDTWAQVLPQLQGILGSYILKRWTLASPDQKNFLVDTVIFKMFRKLVLSNEKEKFVYKGEQAFIGWMLRIALRTLLNEFRDEGHVQFVSLEHKEEIGSIAVVVDFPEDKILDALTNEEILPLIEEAINKLGKNQRTVFELAYKQSLKNPEIARRLNSTVAIVKALKFRATVSVRKYIENIQKQKTEEKKRISIH